MTSEFCDFHASNLEVQWTINRRKIEKKLHHKETAEFTLWTGWEWKFSIRNLDLLTMVLYDHCSLVHLVEHRGSRLLSTAVIVDCSTDVERMLEGLLVMCATRLVAISSVAIRTSQLIRAVRSCVWASRQSVRLYSILWVLLTILLLAILLLKILPINHIS